MQNNHQIQVRDGTLVWPKVQPIIFKIIETQIQDFWIPNWPNQCKSSSAISSNYACKGQFVKEITLNLY